MRLVLLFLFVLSTALSAQSNKVEKKFWNQFHDFCGMSFEGQMVFPELDEGGADHVYAGKELALHFSICKRKLIGVSFTANGEQESDWQLKKKWRKPVELASFSPKFNKEAIADLTGKSTETMSSSERMQTFEVVSELGEKTLWTLTTGSDFKYLSWIIRDESGSKLFHANFKLVALTSDSTK